MTQPTHNTKNLVIDMQPVGRRIDIEPGTTLLEAAQASGVGLVSLCGGEGWCESCLVRITNGKVNPPIFAICFHAHVISAIIFSPDKSKISAFCKRFISISLFIDTHRKAIEAPTLPLPIIEIKHTTFCLSYNQNRAFSLMGNSICNTT